MSTLHGANTQSPSALDHLRVLDLTSYLSQMCGRVLGDLGADVIKVEPPGGDPARLLPPFAGDQRDPERSLRFINVNRSKRSVVLDLDSSEERAKIGALADRADILIEDFAPGYLATLGLGYEDLREMNPGLVYVSITPFGQSGPHAGFRGGDLVSQASSGVMIANGDDEMRPCMAPYEITSQVTCIQGAYGALLAIRSRRRTGQGQHVDVSRQEANISTAHPYISRYSREKVISRREGRMYTSGAVNTFRCADGGYANLSVYMDDQWAHLARDVMNHPILSEEVWLDRDVRRDNREIIDAYVQEYAASVERDDFVERGQRNGVPIVPLLTIDEFAQHPHPAERQFFVEMDHPVIGRHWVPGPPVRFSATPWQSRRPAPLLGQDTEEVLLELEEIPPRRLASEGAQSAGKGSSDGARPGSSTAAPIRPLEGVRVADFTHVTAGYVATRFLAYFGTEDINVEEAGVGRIQELQELKRCKLSCVIDARKPGGTDLIHELVSMSDVVVENYRPGVMDRLGNGYEALRQVKPDLIMISMPGMGNSGPLRDYMSYGQQVMGLTGLFHIWGHPESSLDTRIKMPYPDFVSGALAALSVVAALEWRDRTGEGQYIEVAQVEGTAHLLGVAYMDYLLNGRVAQPQGNRSDYQAPHDVYPCLGYDAWCAIEVGNEEQWQALVGAIRDQGAWAKDKRFQTMEGRLKHKEEMDAYLGDWTRGFTPRQLMLMLQKVGVPAGIVSSGEDLYHDLHLRSRPGAIVPIEHPGIGTLEYSGVNVHLSATPGLAAVANPSRGQHNDYVFRELLGRDQASIQKLTEAGIIG